MKKNKFLISFIVTFIFSFFFMGDAYATTCIYEYNENGKKLTFYTDVDRSTNNTPVVNIMTEISKKDSLDNTKHTVKDTKWSIKNWNKEYSDVVIGYKGTNDSALCPNYLVYDANSKGDDSVYFADSKGSVVLKENRYIFERRVLSNIPDCVYFKKIGIYDSFYSKSFSGAVLGVWYNNGEIVYSINNIDKENSFSDEDYVKEYLKELYSTELTSTKFKDNFYYFETNNQRVSVTFSSHSRDVFYYEYQQNSSCPNLNFAQDGNNFYFSDWAEIADQKIQYKFSKDDLIASGSEDKFSCGPYDDYITKSTLESLPISLKFERVGEKYYYSYIFKGEDGNDYASKSEIIAGVDLTLEYEDVVYSIILDYDTVFTTYKELMDQNKCPSFKKVNLVYDNDPRYMFIRLSGNDTGSIYDLTFSQKLSGLKRPLALLDVVSLSHEVYLKNDTIALTDIKASDLYCDFNECFENPKYYTEIALKDITNYCYYATKSGDLLKKKECESYFEFYDDLVSRNVVSNLAEGCEFMTTDLQHELNFILNIFRIAAPILVILLGMIDFTKAVVSADADKATKDAAKSFKNRLFAAVLLFLTPTILAFLLNLFIGDEIESDNPFCKIDELYSNQGSNSNSGTSGWYDDSFENGVDGE